MSPRRLQIKKLLKLSAIVIGALLLLFFLVDDVVMPRYTQQGKTTRVPSVVGLTLEEAKKVLRESGLDPKESEFRPDKQYPVGTVALQNPPADADVKFGRGVYLTVSGGEVLVAVPVLRGKSLRDATFNLERFGLKLGSIQYEASEELFENTIISQEIAAGTRVKNGTVVNVTVSQGRSSNKQPAPNVVLKTLTEAEKMITRSGFKVGNLTYQVSLDLLPNTVIEQYPRPGALVTIGQAIDLFVAQKLDKKTNLEN